ncbi:MAG TPA: hypothetical protein QF753_18195 [Victivallales bacterium]|nr:hypothetical protein [Victivallales bacterium]
MKSLKNLFSNHTNPIPNLSESSTIRKKLILGQKKQQGICDFSLMILIKK